MREGFLKQHLYGLPHCVGLPGPVGSDDEDGRERDGGRGSDGQHRLLLLEVEEGVQGLLPLVGGGPRDGRRNMNGGVNYF